jgi:hypothetical protein
LRPLVRDDLLGTLVTISGVVCFTIFQGEPRSSYDSTEFSRLAAAPVSLAWLTVMGTLLVTSMVWLRLCPVSREDASKQRQRWKTLAVTQVCACSSAFMDLATKAWSAVLRDGVNIAARSPLFWLAVAANLSLYLVMRSGMIYGCRHCDVLTFVPLHMVFNIFMSVLTGMTSLQEYETVTSWPGLSCTTVSILSGIFMLISGPATVISAPKEEDNCPDSKVLESPSSPLHGLSIGILDILQNQQGFQDEVDSSGASQTSPSEDSTTLAEPSSLQGGKQGGLPASEDLCWCLARQGVPQASPILCLNRVHRQAARGRSRTQAVAGLLRKWRKANRSNGKVKRADPEAEDNGLAQQHLQELEQRLG